MSNPRGNHTCEYARDINDATTDIFCAKVQRRMNCAGEGEECKIEEVESEVSK